MGLSEQGTVTITVKGDDKTGGAFKSALKNIQGLGKAALAAGIGAVAAGGAAMAAVGAKGITEFIKFEDAMNEVFTLLPGISGQAMAQMTEQVKDASVEMGRMPEEVIPALYQALSAGVPQDNVFAFLETAHKTALGGVTDLETAVDALSSVTNAYGLDVISTEEASDLLFTAVKGGKTTMDELGASISRVTPTTASLGVSFADVTAGLATITSQGVKTKQASTKLSQMFNELGKTGSNVDKIFREISGGSFQEFIAAGGDTQSALGMLKEYADDADLTMKDLFGSIEAGDAALILSGAGSEKFAQELDNMANSAGATEQAYEQMNEGLARTVEVLKARMQTILLDVGEALAPLVSIVGDALLNAFATIQPYLDTFIGAIGDFITLLQNGTEPIEAFRETFLVGMLEGMGVADETIASITTTFDNMMLAIDNIVIKVQEFIDQVVAFVEPLTTWVQQNVELKDVLIVVGGILASIIVPAIISLVAPIALAVAAFAGLVAVVAILRNAWESDFGGMRTNLTAFWENTVRPALEKLREWLEINLPIALETLSTFWNEVLLPAIENVVEFVTGTLMPTFADLVENAMENVKQMTDDLSKIWQDVLLPAFTAVWDFITESLIPLLTELWENVLENVRQMTEDLSTVWNETLKPAFENVSSFIKETLIPAIQNLIEWIGEKLRAAIDTATTGWDLFKQGIESIKSVIDKAKNWVQGLIDKLNSISVPDIVMPGSPTPFEIGLRGIGAALEDLNNNKLPVFIGQMSRIGVTGKYGEDFRLGTARYTDEWGKPAPSMVREQVTNNEFNLFVSSNLRSGDLANEFEFMKAMVIA